jgi:serine O-acetyltransferase
MPSINEPIRKRLDAATKGLSSPTSYNMLYHRPNHGMPMPSVQELSEIVNLAQELIFPGYFGLDILNEHTLEYYTGVSIDKLYRKLSEQIRRGYCFACDDNQADIFCSGCEFNPGEITAKFIERLPYIRQILATDIKAAYEGDPAAMSIGEVIFCYPAVRAMLNYRIAHELHLLKVPLIPRIISEMAHSQTGIDINPEAQIGECFTIDHGTGVVIGATAIIGRNVKLYQGVTLGAKSFPLDENGKPIKGVPRHPIVEDDVVIYSNATVLGRITVGKGAVIGGNVWVTNDVAPGAKILQFKPRDNYFFDGGGI